MLDLPAHGVVATVNVNEKKTDQVSQTLQILASVEKAARTFLFVINWATRLFSVQNEANKFANCIFRAVPEQLKHIPVKPSLGSVRENASCFEVCLTHSIEK